MGHTYHIAITKTWGIFAEERAEIGARGSGNIKETTFSGQKHMISQHAMHDLHKFKPDKTPRIERARWAGTLH